MRDDDELLSTPGLEFGSGIVGVCDICRKRQAVIVLLKERYKLCVIDFLNKTWLESKAAPGRPLPPYRSERIFFPTSALPTGKAPAIVLSPTRPVRRPVVLLTPDVYGITTSVLDGAIRLARDGFEVLVPEVGKTAGIGPMDHLSLRSGAITGGGVPVSAPRVRRLLGLYADALRALRSREMVDPTRSALVGLSFGGALALGLAGEDRETTAVAVAYPVPVRPAEHLRLVTAPIFAVAGARDRRALAAVGEIEAAAARGEVTAEVLRVPGVGHNFLSRDLRAYDLAAAEEVWGRLVTFVHGRLVPPPPKPPARPATQPAPPPTAAPARPVPAPASPGAGGAAPA